MNGPVRRGLAGVVADTTAVSEQDGEASTLTYRGYPVQDLARHRSLEEVAHPAAARPAAECRRARRLLRARTRPAAAHAGGMAGARGLPPRRAPHRHAAHGPQRRRRRGLRGAPDGRRRPRRRDVAHRHHPHHPGPRRAPARRPAPPAAGPGHRHGPTNFLAMYFGVPPAPEVARAFEMSLVLYAEWASTRRPSRAHLASTAATCTPRSPPAGRPQRDRCTAVHEREWRVMRDIGDPAGRPSGCAELEEGGGSSASGTASFPPARPARRADARGAGHRRLAPPRGPPVLAMHDRWSTRWPPCATSRRTSTSPPARLH